MAIDGGIARMPSLEKFSCLFGVSHGNHLGSVPIETMVVLNGVRKYERQGVPSADGQLMFVDASPKSSACMAYVSARAVRTRNAINDVSLLLFEYGVLYSR